jgi:NAD(P)-dependent dehydrogenase (short-subunit alcohol dehydrogenase family)
MRPGYALVRDPRAIRHTAIVCVVNNAGVGAARPFVELSDAELDLNLDVNLRDHPHDPRSAPRNDRARRRRGRQHLLAGGQGPAPTTSHYSASKAGVLGFTVYLAAEAAPAVRVNAICPGMVMTGMMQNKHPARHGERSL